MSWKTTALIAAAVLTTAAAHKPATPKAATPAADKPATAAKPSAVQSLIADFDARNPLSVIALLNFGGAKASLVSKDGDTVLVNITSVAANFTALFASCDAQGRACRAVQFDYVDDKAGPSFAQLNAFNQTTAMCRTYEDRASKPHVVFSTLLFADDPFEHFRTETAAWTGCIGEFQAFLKDPNGYLASAP